MLTVRELLADLGLEVLAGEAGLDRPVRWVHMSELADPTRWLSGGEMLLTNGMALTGPTEQRDFIERLADRGLAGLGFATGFGHDRVPPALLDAAAQRDFPVFEVAYDLPFIAITEAAFSRLVNDEYALLRRALHIQERLERLVLSERGLEAICAELAHVVGAQVSVTTTPPEAVDPHTGVVLGVAVDGSAQTPPEAWLVAVKATEDLSDFDRLVLRQAVTIVALELLRGRVAQDTERRLAGDVLSAVLAGELTAAELTRRVAPFGLGEQLAVLVSGAELGPALARVGESGLLARHDDLHVALVPGREETALFDLAERVAAEAAATVGVGRSVMIERARRGYLEARCAYEAITLGLGETPGGSVAGAGVGSNGSVGQAGMGLSLPTAAPRVATYHDLGSYQLLLSLQDDAALGLFCDSVLGAIEGAEGHYGGELIRSLEAFIEENGQWERAARRLFVHRHTLRYRIKRVEELTGRDLTSARDRIEFWLALRGRELIS